MTRQEAIDKVTEYLWADEQRHWEESEKPLDHIFCALLRLKERQSSDVMEIKVAEIVDDMIERGITVKQVADDNMDGWTNTLVDTLEEVYLLESEISAEYKRREEAVSHE